VSASSTVTVDGARCAVHPDRAAIGVCSRCGDYHCGDCHKLVGARPLCASCRALPGVDYLEDTRLRYWGKRDGYVWYFGLFAPLGTMVSLPQHASSGDYVSVASSLAWFGLSIAYLALEPWSRRAILLGTIALGLVGLANTAFGTGRQLTGEQLSVFGGKPGALAFGAAASLVAVLIVTAAYQSPRNKLAFKLPVTDAELAKVYDLHGSNPLARRAFWYGLLLSAFPLLSAITLGMGIVALRRADPEAWPPRGGRKPAIAAIVISSLALCGWLAFIAWTMMRLR
jgi:hypothetical protein